MSYTSTTYTRTSRDESLATIDESNPSVIFLPNAIPQAKPATPFDIMLNSLPTHVWKTNLSNAILALLIPIILSGAWVYILQYYAFWFIVPIGWGFMALYALGFSTIARDCARNQFTGQPLIDYIIGTLSCAVLLLPYETWRNIDVETDKLEKSQKTNLNQWWLLAPKQWLLSTGAALKFGLKAIINMALLFSAAGYLLPIVYQMVGVWGLLKFYFIPLAFGMLLMSWRLAIERILSNQKADKPVIVRCIPNISLLSSGGMNIWLNEGRSAKIPAYNRNEALHLINEKFKRDRQISMEAALLFQTETPKPRDPICPLTDEIDWRTSSFLLISPIVSVYSYLYIDHPHIQSTWTIFWISSITGGLSITCGYHRLFAHRAYEVWRPIRIIITLFATQTFQGSVFWWVIDHRDHHRYTDTDLDPYNAKRGFFYSHMGWLFTKRVRGRDRIVKCDISDLKADPFLRFQNRYYNELAVFLGFVVPSIVCGLGWGDWLGGFFVAGVASKVLVMHITFCVNSVAHYIGDFTFSDQRTPRDAFVTSFLTMGEGYHNFHHEFPYDYRNGVFWYAWDPTKWLVRGLEMIGLAWNLVRYPADLIEKGRLQMIKKDLDRQMARLDWGPEISKLPIMTREQYSRALGNLILVDGVIYDMTKFLDKHPGGRGVLTAFLGKDASVAFNGGVYNHSNCARNILKAYAIARIDLNSPEVESSSSHWY